MIERVLYGASGAVLLNLYRQSRAQALYVKAESLPEMQLQGGVELVAGTGVRVFVGDRRPTAGSIEVTLGTYGQTHEDAFALQREILGLAPLIAGYGRVPGGTLEIAACTSVKRAFSGSPQLGGSVTLTLECASPYFWQAERHAVIAPGYNAVVFIGGQARTPLRIELTAGGNPVTNPAILTDAGLTRWLGTIPAHGTLLINGLDYTVTLNGADAELQLTGPQPHLEPGERTMNITAPGATASIYWREGEL